VDIEESLRAALQALPEVAAGLKRPGVPPPLRVLFTDLGPRHLPVLSTVLLDGPASIGELADRLGLAMPTASLLVRDLDRAGLVTRAEDPQDRRRRLVGINPEHHEAVEGWLEQRARPIRTALERLTPEQRQAFSRGLAILAEELTRQTGGAPRAG
jgi:DNA-binding MarR family transcriptional regulator